MHELGVLRQIVKTVSRIAEQNHIRHIKHITLEVGRTSGFVPYYLEKLFPVAIDSVFVLRGAELRIQMAEGNGLLIRDIGY